MTPQEIFDKVATHLMTQGKRSVDSIGMRCRYRDGQGNSCAVGCLFPASVDTDPLEDLGIEHDAVVEAIEPIIRPINLEKLQLLNRLQSVHDIHSVCDWVGELYRVATLSGLNTEVLDQ